jgi:large subunit ribosomal protein L17
MYHNCKGRKFNRHKDHRKALLRNLAKAVIMHESIRTTLPKAKDIRPIVEKLVTKGKNPSLHVRRQIISKLGGDTKVVTKLLNEISTRYATRNGGYLRIIKTGFRKGDAAPMAIIQFVSDEDNTAKISS